MRSISSSLAAFSLLAVVTGCGGPHWIVRSQAAPDPFVNQRAFAVAPVDFRGMTVGQKTEADYLASKTPEQQAAFAGDKEAVAGEFMSALSSRAAGDGIQIVPLGSPGSQTSPVLHPTVYWIEPGYYVGVSSAPAQIKMNVKITSPDGAPIDDIEVLRGYGGGFSTTQRMSRAGSALGESTEGYLKLRVSGAAK